MRYRKIHTTTNPNRTLEKQCFAPLFSAVVIFKWFSPHNNCFLWWFSQAEDKEEEDVSGEPEASPSADTTILFVKGEGNTEMLAFSSEKGIFFNDRLIFLGNTSDV